MAARVDGVDLSHWQSGPLDFGRAQRAGLLFIAHKATESTGYVDPLHDRRRGEVNAAGLAFGSYHFARPADSSGAAQARHFLEHAGPVLPGDLAPMLDLEDRGGLGRAALTGWVDAFVAAVRERADRPPLVYTPFDLDDDFGCPLWVARYSDAMTAPRIPEPWTRYTIWQFSNGQYGHPASVDGIGPCDLNTLNTDRDGRQQMLDRIRIGGPTEEDDMTPEQEKQLASIAADVNGIGKALAAFREAERGRDQKLLQRVADLSDGVAERVVAAMQTDQPAVGGMPPEQMKRIVRSEVIAGVRQTLGSLDEP